MLRIGSVFPLLVAFGCAAPAPDAPGPFVPGHRTITTTRGERTLVIEVWYPSANGVASEEPIASYVTDGARRARYEELLAKAPAGCATRSHAAARDAAPAEGPLPLLVFSHCHGCTRFSSASLALHLASHGFAVAAPDHAGNTLFDELDGKGLPLDTTTLRLRADDQRFVLDLLLDPMNAAVPAELRGRFDPARVGAFGHSFGSVTTGLLAQEDARVKAVAGIAAPLENALLPGVSVESLAQPLLFVLAREDNSITELGNANLRDNFREAPGAAWIVEVADAGHWSFSDIAGLHENFAAGCGEAPRQTNSAERFRYLPAADGIAITRAHLAAFFRAQLLGDTAAQAFLDAPPTDARVTIDAR